MNKPVLYSTSHTGSNLTGKPKPHQRDESGLKGVQIKQLCWGFFQLVLYLVACCSFFVGVFSYNRAHPTKRMCNHPNNLNAGYIALQQNACIEKTPEDSGDR